MVTLLFALAGFGLLMTAGVLVWGMAAGFLIAGVGCLVLAWARDHNEKRKAVTRP